MYRTTDPRFRRRINDLTQTLESANESAQSGLYIFGQQYIKPCFQSIGTCLGQCFDASCPALSANQRDRIRRQRGRGQSRGRAELNFDFYDDWDEDENDGLLGGWGNDEFDRLVGASGSGATQGYGTVNAQPGRQRGMSYPKARRKSAVGAAEDDPTVIPGSSAFWRRLFGGGNLRYTPSAAGLQEHPGAHRKVRARDLTEGEALLAEGGRVTGRARSGTQGSRDTSDSYSSRGDIFPSDEELDDAIPLDDEFAMVLERRTTLPGHETESSSGKTGRGKRGKRPSAGSRTSTRSFSSRSLQSQSGSGRRQRRSRNSSAAHTPISEVHVTEVIDAPPMTESIPSLADLKREEAQVERDEEDGIHRRRSEAQRLAAERCLTEENLSSKEATPRSITPAPDPTPPATVSMEEPSQLPTPLPTDDEEDRESRPHQPSEAQSEEEHSKPQQMLAMYI